MIQKKVCMLGAFAVGKTSLVERYVKSIFSEKYQTTVGVKIDKREVLVGATTVKLVLWDLHGEDRFQAVQASYLRGASGVLLVVDPTRPSTLGVARTLLERSTGVIGTVPTLVLLNKCDLSTEWAATPAELEGLAPADCPRIYTSAKSGQGVEEAFARLAEQMLAP